MSKRHTAIPASYVIFRRGDEILLTLRQNTGYFDGWYVVPSGHIEEGELPIDGALREVEEEVGLMLDRTKLRLAHTMYRTKHDDTGDRADYFFVVDTWEGKPINKEPMKCKEIAWFPLGALPEKVMPHVRDALEAIQKGEMYSELGLDRIVQSPID